MRQYELTYLISDSVPESDLNKVTGKVGGFVTGLGGKILKEEIWGRRKLAYPIGKQDFATYVTLNFDLPREKTVEIEKDLKLYSKIIRHLMIVNDYGQEELTLTEKDIVETEAIEKVVGGEKSFEAVVGETKESRDLMAVRGDKDEEEDKETEESSKEEVEIKEKVKEEEKAEETKEAKPEIAEEPADETEEKPVLEEKEEVAESDEKEEPIEEKAVEEEKKEEKAEKKKAAKPRKKKEDEVDRLSKLDKELDEILGDDL